MAFLVLMDKLELQEEMVQEGYLVHQDNGVLLEHKDHLDHQEVVDLAVI